MAKHVASERLKRTVIDALRRDPNALKAAEQVADRQLTAGRAAGKSRENLIDKELAAMAGRRIDPVMDYIYGTAVGGVARARPRNGLSAI